MGVNLPKFTNITAPRTRTDWEAHAETAIDAAIAAAIGVDNTAAGVTAAALSLNGPAKTNLDRFASMSNLSALTTQVMTSVAIPLQAGQIVTNISFVSATTAANTPTNYWFALYSPSGAALRAQTADQTSTAWGANTVKTLALVAPYTVTASGIYYVGIMVKATTPPTLAGVALHNAVLAGNMVGSMSVLAQTSGVTLTDTAPASIATPTTIATVPLVIVS
jgi:hypothetical protein